MSRIAIIREELAAAQEQLKVEEARYEQVGELWKAAGSEELQRLYREVRSQQGGVVEGAKRLNEELERDLYRERQRVRAGEPQKFDAAEASHAECIERAESMRAAAMEATGAADERPFNRRTTILERDVLVDGQPATLFEEYRMDADIGRFSHSEYWQPKEQPAQAKEAA